jgi:mevalonate kinase
MSDFSLLYKKYNSVSNLTNDLNNSVIVLKRRKMSADPKIAETHPRLHVQDEEVTKATQDITGILKELDAFYEKQDTSNFLYEMADNQLFQKHIMGNVEYRERIREALVKLKASQELTVKELSGIDKFVSVLDNQASKLYRKLRSTRE